MDYNFADDNTQKVLLSFKATGDSTDIIEHNEVSGNAYYYERFSEYDSSWFVDIQNKIMNTYFHGYKEITVIDDTFLKKYEYYDFLLYYSAEDIVDKSVTILSDLDEYINRKTDIHIVDLWETILLDIANNNTIPIRNQGSGIKRLCAIFDFSVKCYRDDSFRNIPTIFAIDEAELSLHPSQQRIFVNILKDLSKNFQIIITTHSPYIVNELDEKSVCLLKLVPPKDANGHFLTDVNGNPIETVTTKAINNRIINYPSMAEINYLAFDEPSMTYHQELFCHIEIEWGGQSNGSIIKGILETMNNISSFKNRIDAILPPNTITSPDFEPSDTLSDKYLSLLDNRFYREDKLKMAHDCICRCVRDSIDHTSTKNYKWKYDKIVELSLKILVIVAEYFAKAKEVLKNYSLTDAASLLDSGSNKNFTIDGDSNKHTLNYCCWYFLNHPNTIIKKDGIVHQIKTSAIFGIVKNSL